MRSKSFEYNQEHPNNEVIIKDIKLLSKGGIELDEEAINNLRSDYKQHLAPRPQKGVQRPQQKQVSKNSAQKNQHNNNNPQRGRMQNVVRKNNNDNSVRHNSQK
jgi:hypothetical protein